MSELEDKLNQILSSPEDMEKIMGMARSLSGSSNTHEPEESKTGSAPPLDFGSLSSLLGNIDPKLIRLFGRVMSEYSSQENDKSALFSAIKPYLKEDRREKIDRAAEVAKMAQLARTALSEFSGGE